MYFNEKIKHLRKQKDMTQEQLAEYMCVSPQAVSRWETGITCPDISALPQLSELFCVSVDELLGIDEKEKRREISSIVIEAEEQINQNITAEPIIRLREALNKYPNNERLLCCLMYALYAASEDEELCKEYDAEIVSIAYRIREHSRDSDLRNESNRILFRHYCDTGRKAEALQLADKMASIETSLERNIYWALEGDDRLDYLKERISDDLNYLLWDIWAYSVHADISDKDVARLDSVRDKISQLIKDEFQNIEAYSTSSSTKNDLYQSSRTYDSLLKQAIEIAKKSSHVSVSKLQLELNIGYGTAQEIFKDLMEKEKVKSHLKDSAQGL